MEVTVVVPPPSGSAVCWLLGPTAGLQLGFVEIDPDPPAPLVPSGVMEIDVYAPALLLWLDQKAQEQPGIYVDVMAFEIEQNLAPGFVQVLVTRLKQGCLITTTGLAEPHCLITPLGQAEAQRCRELRKDRRARTHYSRDALLRWLFDKGADHNAQYVHEFVTAPESFFLGDHLTVAEVVAAVRYLAKVDLVEPVGVGSDASVFPVRITASGFDCATSGGSVSDYLAGQAASGNTYYNVHNPHGSIIGGQHQTVNQTNAFRFNPAEVGKLLNLATLVRQIGPTLDLPQAEETELLAGAEDLEAEAGAGTPDQGRLRRAADRVVGALRSATKVTAALTLLADEGHKAYCTVFGG